MMTTPSIYIACLAAYNHGILHGEWVQVADDPDALRKEAQRILATSPIEEAEEWAIHDSENFEGIHIDEYESFQSVCRKAAFINEYGRLGAIVYDDQQDIDTAETMLTSAYEGAFESVEDYARSMIDQTGYLDAMPDVMCWYFDYAAFARDLEVLGDITVYEESGKRHIFMAV